VKNRRLYAYFVGVHGFQESRTSVNVVELVLGDLPREPSLIHGSFIPMDVGVFVHHHEA
jgi:hypothetical protein